MVSSWDEARRQWDARTGGTSPRGLSEAAVAAASPFAFQGSWADTFAAARQARDLYPRTSESSWLGGDYSRPRWLTGGQYAGTDSGWNTPFYQTMFKQMDEAAREGKDAPSIYDRQDYTGIITSDAMEGVKVGRTRQGGKFGDIFQSGRRVGNLYEAYDRHTANTILGQLTLDREQQARAFSAADVESRLEEEVERQRKNNTEALRALRTQKPYQRAVDERQKELLDSGGFTAASVGAGAAGGAIAAGLGLAGLLLAPISGGASIPLGAAVAAGVAGGAAGGLGAWLNRDQLSEEVARAQVQYQMQEAGGSQLATGLMNWSQVAESHLLGTFTNLYQGTYDAVSSTGDGIGDGVSAFYAIGDDGERLATGWQQVLGHGMGFLDFVGVGAGAFKTITRGGKGLRAAAKGLQPGMSVVSTKYLPSAMGLYQTTMSGTILGGLGELTIGGGEVFDDASGTFVNLYDGTVDQWAAGWGSVMIDAAQLGLARGLSAKANASWRGAKGSIDPATGQAIDGWQPLSFMEKLRAPKGAVSFQEVNGLRFFRNQDKQIIDKVVRPVTTFMAPSELIDSIPPRFHAMRQAAGRNGALTADDIYRAANRMMSGGSKVQTALINGFGEGFEEIVQEILDPYALGYNPFADPEDILEAAIQGFVMGTGMSIGTGARTASKVRRDYQRYEQMMEFHGQSAALPFESFQELPDAAREKLMLTHGEDLFSRAAKQMANARAHTMVATRGEEIFRLAELTNTVLKKQLGEYSDSVEDTLLVSSSFAGDTRADAVEISHERLVAKLVKEVGLMEAQANYIEAELRKVEQGKATAAPGTPADVTMLRRAGVLASKLAVWAGQQGTLIEQQRQSKRKEHVLTRIEKITTETNQVLQALYDMSTDAATLTQLLEDLDAVEELGLKRRGSDGQLVLDREARVDISRAVALSFTRPPMSMGSSLQVSLALVSPILTLERANNAAKLSHATLPLINGDFDGDKIKEYLQGIVTKDVFVQKRAGQDFITGEGDAEAEFVFGERGNEGKAWDLAYFGINMPETKENLPQRQAVEKFLDTVGDSVKRYLADTVVPREVLDAWVENFKAQFRNETPEADAHLSAYNALIHKVINNYSVPLIAEGQREANNLILRIEDEVSEALRKFLDEHAATLRSDLSNLQPAKFEPPELLAQPLKQKRDAETRVASQARSLLDELILEFPGSEPVRSIMSVHYSVQTALDSESAEVDLSASRQRAVKQFAAVNTGITETKAEARQKLSLQETVAEYFLEMSLAYQRATGHFVSPLVFSRMGVGKVATDAVTGELSYPGKGAMSWVQSALLAAIQQEKAELQAANAVTTEKEAEWASLSRLLSQGTESLAMAEVFGHVPKYLLGGAEYASLGGMNLTLNQNLAQLQSMSSETRRNVLEEAKLSEHYAGELSQDGTLQTVVKMKNGKPILSTTSTAQGYKLFVDLLSEVSHLALRDTDSGLASGFLGDLPYTDKDGSKRDGTSLQYSKLVRETFKEANQLIADVLGMTVDSVRSKYKAGGDVRAALLKQIREFRNNNPDLDIALLRSFPEKAQIMMASLNPKGDGYLSGDWMSHLFAADPARAEVILRSEMIFHEFKGIVQNFDGSSALDKALLDSSITNRVIKALVELYVASREAPSDSDRIVAAALLKEYEEKMQSAETIEELVKYENENIRFDSDLMFTAWTLDRGEFDHLRMGLGRTEYVDATRRVEFQKFSDLIKSIAKDEAYRRSQDPDAEAKYATQVLETVNLLEQIDESDNGTIMYNGQPLTEAGLENASRIRAWMADLNAPASRVPLGADAVQMVLTGSLIGLDANAYSKGETQPYLKALGAYDAKGEHLDWGDAYLVSRAGLTASDVDGLEGNIDLLRDNSMWLVVNTKGDRVYWKVDNPAKFILEQWQNPDNIPILLHIFGEKVADLAPGKGFQLQEYLASPPTLKEWIESYSPQDVLRMDEEGKKPSAQAFQKYFTRGLAEGQLTPDGAESLIELTNDMTIALSEARTGRLTASEAAQLSSSTQVLLGELSSLIGQLTPDQSTFLQQKLSEWVNFEVNPTVEKNFLVRVSTEDITQRALAFRISHEIEMALMEEYELTKQELYRELLDIENSRFSDQDLLDAGAKKVRFASQQEADAAKAEIVVRLQEVQEQYNSAILEMHKSRDQRTNVKDSKGFSLVTNPLASVIQSFSLTEANFEEGADPAARLAQQRKIADYTANHREVLEIMYPKVKEALIDASLAAQPQITVKFGDATFQLPNFSPKIWITLSQAITTHEINKLYQDASPETVTASYPGEDSADAKYFDPSYSYLLSDLFDPSKPFYQTSRKLFKETARQPSPGIMQEVADLVQKTMNRKTLKGWTPLTAAHSIQAKKNIASSGVFEAVPRVGNRPKQDLAEAMYSTRTTEKVPAELYSKAAIRVDYMLSEDEDSPYYVRSTNISDAPDTPAVLTKRKGMKLTPGIHPVQLAVKNPVEGVKDDELFKQVSSTISTQELHGRQVQSISILVGPPGKQTPVTFATGKTTETNIFSVDPGRRMLQGYFAGRDGESLAGDLLSLRALKANLPAVLALAENTDEIKKQLRRDKAEMVLEVEYVDANSLPATGQDWATYGNNVGFEGIIGEGSADAATSLLAEAVWSHDGIMEFLQELGIQAGKKGHRANPRVRMEHLRKVQQAADVLWRTDFAQMIRLKAIALINQEVEGQVLGAGAYNWARKLMMNSHWVKATKDGETLFFSAEQIIQMQKFGVALEVEYSDLELIIASPKMLRTMLGEQGDQGLGSVSEYSGYDPLSMLRTKQPVEETTRFLEKGKEITPEAFLAENNYRFVMPRPYSPQFGRRFAAHDNLADPRYDRIMSRTQTEMLERSRDSKTYREARYRSEESILNHIEGILHSESQVNQVRPLLAMSTNITFNKGSALRNLSNILVKNHLDGNKMNRLLLIEAHSDPKRNLSRSIPHGVYTNLNPKDRSRLPQDIQRLTPYDTVAIDVAGYMAENGAKLPVLQDTLDVLSETGVKIALISSDASIDAKDLAGRFLEERGYKGSPMTQYLMEYNGSVASTQNLRAIESRAFQTHSTAMDSKSLMIFAESTKGFEGGMIINPNEASPGEIISSPVLPTTESAYFNLPVGEQIGELRNKLVQQFASKDFIKFLHRESGRKGKVELDEAISRFKTFLEQNPNPQRLILDDLKFGDLIPFYNAQMDQVFFYRYNHKVNMPEVVAKLSAAAQAKARGETEYQVAIASPQIDQAHTGVEGEVIDLVRDRKYGHRLRIRTRISALAGKVQAWGLKLVGADTTQMSLMPQESLFSNVDFKYAVDIETAAVAKQTARELMVIEFQKGFQVFGHDIERSILKTFLGVDLVAETDADKRQQYIDQARGILEALDNSLQKFHFKDVMKMVQDATGGGNLGLAMPQLRGIAGDLDAVLQATHDMKVGLQNHVDTLMSQSLSEADYDSMATLIAILYLSTDGTSWRNITGFGGYADWAKSDIGGVTQVLDSYYTGMYDRLLKYDSPARAEAFRRFTARFNRSAQTGDPVVWIGDDWRIHWTDRNGNEQSGYLGFTDVVFHGDSTESLRQSEARRTHQKFSIHDQNFQAMANKSYVPQPKDFDHARQQLDRVQAWDMDKSLAEDLFSPLSELTATLADTAKNPHFKMPRFYTELQRREMQKQAEALKGNRQLIDFSDWNNRNQEIAEGWIRKIRQRTGLSAAQARLVHYWIRAEAGVMQVFQDDGQILNEKMEWQRFLDAAETIFTRVDNNELPLRGSDAKSIHVRDLRALYKANQGPDPVYQLSNGTPGEFIDNANWADWVNVSIGSFADVKGVEIHDFYKSLANANMSSYAELGEEYSHLLVTPEMLDEAGLLNPDGLARMSWHHDSDEALSQEQYYDIDRAALQDSMINLAKLPYQKGSGPQLKRQDRRRFLRTRGLREIRTREGEDYRKKGQEYNKELASNNAFVQGIIQLRVITSLGNPALPVSAILEATIWGGLSDFANMLTGDSSQGLAKLSQLAREKSPEAMQQFLDQVMGKSNLTLEQMRKIDSVSRTTGNTPDARRMFFEEAAIDRPEGRGAITRALGKATRFVSMLQEPGFGMNATTLSRRYLEGAIAFATRSQASGLYIDADTIIDNYNHNPRWIQENLPPMIHQAGMNAVADTRGLKETPLSLAIKGMVEPLADNRSLWVSMPSTLMLKAPLLFSTYASNVAAKVFGFQGPNAMIAMMLHGRKKPWSKDNGKDSYFNMEKAIESADLYKEFMQSGLSLSALFMFGMLAGGLGFAGEDDEEKLMRRMSRFQGWDYMYDPRKIQNDWRNQDAIFLDAFPPLAAMFAVTPEDSESGYRSMAELNWILKQFAMPLMGMDRFFKTGDVRQIFWGFEEALSSFPIINHRQWTDTVQLNTELADAALEQEQLGNPKNLANAYRYFSQMLFGFERMLFEFSFLNSIYVGQDKYDRDPFKLAEVDRANQVQYDRMGNPVLTKALDTYVDPVTGEVGQAYRKREGSDLDSAIHAEGNFTYMLFKSLITGQNPLNSTYNRFNMPVKQRKIDLEELDLLEAKDLVFSVYNAEAGQEVLTYEGARTILQGIERGSLLTNSPALKNIYLTFDQRKQIQEDWMEDTIQEGILIHGLNEYKAKRRMWEIWDGKGVFEGIMPLKDILWDKEIIPYYPSVTYNQLNTTYVPGPDGMMWATGITRDSLMTAMGIQPIRRFHTDEGNMGADSRINATDPVYKLNTGLRGLERTDESWHIPSDEEIATAQTSALEKALNDAVGDIKDALRDGKGWIDYSGGYGYPRYARRGWSSGGGGGYVNAPRIQAPRGVNDGYGRDVRIAASGRPNIRRANIRRERFSSERGRLKPWQ